MQNGDENEIFPARGGDDGQRGVRRRRPARADGGETAEEAPEQGRPEQREDFPENIGHKGDRPQLGGQLGADGRLFQLGDEEAREGIIGEAAPDGQAFRHAPAAQREADEGGEKQRPHDRGQRHEQQLGPQRPEDARQLPVAPDAQPHLKHQRVEHPHRQPVVGQERRQPAAPPQRGAQGEESHRHEAPLHDRLLSLKKQ